MQTNSLGILSNREQIRSSIKRTFSIGLRQTSLSGRQLQSPTKTEVSKLAYSQSFQNYYTLLEKIGEGANAVVKRCKQNKTATIYAVKILSTRDEEIILITQRVYQMMKRIHHPNIIRPKCLFVNKNTSETMLVMEYCQYPSLRSLICETQFSETQSKLIIKELLTGVEAIHRSGICHRDIKPENILYDTNKKKLKIIDFGISKFMYNRKNNLKQKMWTPTGSIYYKAPEMLKGTDYDQSVDCWAVGVIAYEIIFKRLPFFSEWEIQTIQQIQHSQPNYEGLEFKQASMAVDLIRSLLKKQSSQRVTATEALHHPWIQNQQKNNKSQIYLKPYPSECFILSKSSFSAKNKKLQTSERLNNFILQNDVFQIQKSINVFQSARSLSVDPKNHVQQQKHLKKLSLEVATYQNSNQLQH